MSESAHGVHRTPTENVLERVRDALDERLRWNHGSTLYVRAGKIVTDHDVLDDLRGQEVSAALRELAEGDDKERFIVERTNPDANRAGWKVQRYENVNGSTYRGQ